MNMQHFIFLARLNKFFFIKKYGDSKRQYTYREQILHTGVCEEYDHDYIHFNDQLFMKNCKCSKWPQDTLAPII